MAPPDSSAHEHAATSGPADLAGHHDSPVSRGDVSVRRARTSDVPRIKELIPAYGVKLNDNPGLADEIMGHTASVLGIK